MVLSYKQRNNIQCDKMGWVYQLVLSNIGKKCEAKGYPLSFIPYVTVY